MRSSVCFVTLLQLAWLAAAAGAQTTSLARRGQSAPPNQETGFGPVESGGNPVLEAHSLVAVKVRPEKKFKVHDLITIIVRQQTTFESEGEFRNKRELDVESVVDAFIKFTDGGIGASTFSRGKPNIRYEWETELKSRANKDRQDRLVTRVTAEIIDVKPNGNLVLEARSRQEYDNEVVGMSLTGLCRRDDVTPDNTVLSTQLADLNLAVDNYGAIRDGTRRGWLHWMFDQAKPF